MPFTTFRAQSDTASDEGKSFDVVIERDSGAEFVRLEIDTHGEMRRPNEGYMEIPVKYGAAFFDAMPELVAEARRTGVLPPGS